MYKIYKSIDLSNLINLIEKLQSERNFFQSDILVIKNTDLVENYIKTTLSSKNKIFHSLKFSYPGRVILKFLNQLENFKIEKLIRERPLIIYEDSLSFILFKIKKIKTLESFIKSKKSANLFAHYQRKFPLLIDYWQNDSLMDGKSKEERAQKDEWSLVYKEKYSSLNLVLNLLKEEKEKNLSFNKGTFNTVIIVGEIEEIYTQIFYEISKIYNIEFIQFIVEPLHIENSHFLQRIYKRSVLEKEPSFSLENAEREYLESHYEGESLLNNLRDCFLNEREFKNVKDDSFKIFSLKSEEREREVEVLTNNILSSIAKKSLNSLEACAVISDDIESRRAYIEYNFRKFNLPFKILNDKRSFNSFNYIKGVKKLLSLVSASFSRKELIEFLESASLRKKFKVSDLELEQWIDFLNDANVFLAYNREHKVKLKILNNNTNTWEDGFKRYLISLVWNNKHSTYPGSINPLESYKYDADSIIKLIDIVSPLYNDLSFIEKQELPIRTWTKAINLLIKTYLDYDEESERAILDNIFINLEAFSKDLNQNEVEELKNETLSFEIFKYILLDKIENKKAKNEQNISGILIGSESDFQDLSLEEVHILSEKSTKMNKKEIKNLLNLKEKTASFEEKRLIYLTNIFLNTKNKFYIYTEELSESSKSYFNSNFLNILEAQMREKNVNIDLYREEVPNLNYDKAYFTKNSPLINYDKTAFLLSQAKYKRQEEKNLKREEVFQRESQVLLSVNEVINFSTSPYKYFYENNFNLKIKEREYKNVILNKREDFIFDLYKKVEKGLKLESENIQDYIDLKLREAEKRGELSLESLLKSSKTRLIKSLNKLRERSAELFNSLNLKKTNIIMSKNYLAQEGDFLIYDPIIRESVTIDGFLSENLYKDSDDNYYEIYITNKNPNNSNKTTKTKDYLNLFIKGLILKNIKEVKTAKFIKRINLYLNGKTEAYYYDFQDLDSEMFNSLINLIKLGLSQPIPFYISFIEKLKEDSLSESELLSTLNEMIKNPQEVFIPKKSLKIFYEELYAGFCPYFNQFKSDYKFKEETLSLIKNIYIKPLKILKKDK